MQMDIQEDCPHIKNANLLPIEEFKQINFSDLKCQNCDEKEDLMICLFCGKIFCSQYIKSHFIHHYIINSEHHISLGTKDLNIWCYECSNLNSYNDNNNGCCITSEKAEPYIKIYCDNKNKIKELKEINNEKISNNEKYKKEIVENNNDICQHINNITKDEWNNCAITNGLKDFFEIRDQINFDLLCFFCIDKIHNYDELINHTIKGHDIFIDLNELNIICMKCKHKSNIILIKDRLSFEQKNYIQSIIERFSICPKFLTFEEIYEIKYNKLVTDFSSGKYKNIIFMVGAGISTSAGIPDFRSDDGLFKKLQEKYNLSKPEEFFYISTFLKNPMLFYNFWKSFNLNQTQPTIAHKFINFLTKRNYVKYIFTQNIDGLELKAKIPKEKLVFAHGNSNEGHCPKCQTDIDIEKINEGINKGEIYYCPICKGPCKPKIVFYGESLPLRFFERLQDIKDVDLIIVMGTSLKVFPFSGIPTLIGPNVELVVFNMSKVGNYEYDKMTENNIFIEGKIDENIDKFLKDTKLYWEFESFLKKEY